MSQGKDAYVFVSSVTKPKSENPLTAAQKIAALRAMFPRGVTFVNTDECVPKCGGPVAANDYLREKGYRDITLVAGSDRAPTFGPDAPLWKKGIENGVPAPAFLGLERIEGVGAAGMSGTKARTLARAGKYEEFAAAVRVGEIDDAGIRALYDAIRTQSGGRRKTRRVRRRRRTVRR